jgi:hypothetical protein
LMRGRRKNFFAIWGAVYAFPCTAELLLSSGNCEC